MIFPSTSNRPILLVGNGVRSASAEHLLYEIIEKYHIPVLTTMNAVDLVQDQYHIGFIGTYGNRCANAIVNECDLVIAVGARLGLRQVGKRKEHFAPKAKLIRVDIDQAELGRVIKPDEEQYNMDAQEFLELLLKESIPDYTLWQQSCMKIKSLLDEYDDTDGNKVVKEIGKVLPENPLVAVDVGQHECWVAQSLELRGRKGRILIGGGYGAMGTALPFSIGVAYAYQGRPVYCLTGDGGMQMNLQELEVLKRDNLPIKVLIINNETLGKISEIQRKGYGNRFAQTTKESGYTVPDFECIASSYGIKATTINDVTRIRDFQVWMNDDEPCVINIMLPDDTMLIPKIKWETYQEEPELRGDILEKVNSILNGDVK